MELNKELSSTVVSDEAQLFPVPFIIIQNRTRMHSSRMRTARALTVLGGGVGASQKKFWGKRNWNKKIKKFRDPPKIWRPPQKLENTPPSPQKIGDHTPQKKLETTPTKLETTPPPKLETTPPTKIGDHTPLPPSPPEKLETTPPPNWRPHTPSPKIGDHTPPGPDPPL